MLYHVGDSRHTQNIQINKVIGENEECVFYFIEKTKRTFCPTQYFMHKGGKCLSLQPRGRCTPECYYKVLAMCPMIQYFITLAAYIYTAVS